MTNGLYFLLLQFDTSVLDVVIINLVNHRHVCTVSNLLFTQYLKLCGFSYFELLKCPNSTLFLSNVAVGAQFAT